jgi:hypothetical protein
MSDKYKLDGVLEMGGYSDDMPALGPAPLAYGSEADAELVLPSGLVLEVRVSREQHAWVCSLRGLPDGSFLRGVELDGKPVRAEP